MIVLPSCAELSGKNGLIFTVGLVRKHDFRAIILERHEFVAWYCLECAARFKQCSRQQTSDISMLSCCQEEIYRVLCLQISDMISQ